MNIFNWLLNWFKCDENKIEENKIEEKPYTCTVCGNRCKLTHHNCIKAINFDWAMPVCDSCYNYYDKFIKEEEQKEIIRIKKIINKQKAKEIK